jgi:glycyl-tRNA synthetase
LSLPLAVAPNKVLIVPLSSNSQLNPIAHKLSIRLRNTGIANVIDASSASIGKRYARNDELGTPLGVTVDFDTLKDGSVTSRERDSMVQVRGSEDEIVAAIRGLVEGTETWEEVMGRMEVFGAQDED